MDKKIRNLKSFIVLILLFALLILTACSSFWGNDKEISTASDKNETTITFTGKINLSGNIPAELIETKNKTDRAALPQPIDISSGSNFEYYVTADVQGGESLTAIVDRDDRTFELNLCYGKWTIETGIRRISDEKKILNDIFQTTIAAETPVFSHSFFLTPVDGGDGTINLEMQVPSSIENLIVKIIQKPENSTLTFEEPIATTENTITILKDNVPSGSYVFELNFYDSNYLAFSTVQTVNVLTGLETSKWVSGGTSELLSTGAFVLTDELITVWRSKRSAYYVDSINGNDSNSGSPADPLKTLRKAVSYINDMEYTHIIYVERSFSQEVSEPIEIQKNLTIGVYGSDATKTPVLCRAENSTAESLIYITGSAQVTLTGLTLNGTEDSGIKIANTAKLILNSGRISGCQTGIDNYGSLEINGGTVTECTTGINIDADSNVNVSGGSVLGSTVNLKLPIGKKIAITKQIKEGTQISVTLDGQIKKIKNSGINNAVFTSGYGAYNPTVPPYTYFRNDSGYILSYGTGATAEAEIALSGENFFNSFSDVTVSFAIDKKSINPDTFNNGSGNVVDNTITVTPKVLIKNHSITTQISDLEQLESIDENLSWDLGLYYRGVKLANPDSEDGFYHTNKLIPYGASYKDRYDVHVQMTFLGVKHDAEFVVMGSNTRSISDAADFINVWNDLIQTGETLDVKIELQGDLDFSDPSLVKPFLDRFEGTFDGNGHRIILNKMENESTPAYTRYLGICSVNAGIIQNVIVERYGNTAVDLNQGNAKTQNGIYDGCGPICQTNQGIIRNCWNKVSFKPSNEDDGGYFQRMGGLVMYNEGTIENCLNTAELLGQFNRPDWANWYGFLGGIAGQNGSGGRPGIIKNCVNYGTVKMKTTYKASRSINGAVGAIVGYQENSSSIIENCFFRNQCVMGSLNEGDEPDARNWVTYGGSMPSGCNAGSFIGNGYFDATIENPSLNIADYYQGVSHDDTFRKANLLTALNDYVAEKNAIDPTANLKSWKAATIDEIFYPAVLE